MLGKGFKGTGTLFVDGRWLVVACCQDTSDYYLSFVKANTEKKVGSPVWKSHISLIRNERSPEVMQHLQGKEVSFTYFPESLSTNKKHWWIPVVSPEMIKIRKKLGLFPSPDFPFHWSIGCLIKP